MIRVIVLDTGPLGIVTKPLKAAEVIAINQWVMDCVANGKSVFVPEMADYEIRRELIRSTNTAGIARLDTFNAAPGRYLPLTTAAMRKAADLWAEARNKGYATADPKALDGDVIVAAQALTAGYADSEIIVATDNVAHLSRYVNADLWRNITP
jgi:predicted nucleic acid-binding protein